MQSQEMRTGHTSCLEEDFPGRALREATLRWDGKGDTHTCEGFAAKRPCSDAVFISLQSSCLFFPQRRGREL